MCTAAASGRRAAARWVMSVGIILFFDFSHHTGWAVGHPDARPVFGQYDFPSTEDNFGRHQANVRAWLTATINLHQPDLIGFEQMSLFKNTTPGTMIKLASFTLTLEELCLRENMNRRVRQANPSKMKKFWTGAGNAKKPDMMARARKLGFKVQTDNEADAVAGWHWMIECYGSPEQKERMRQRMFEASMGLQQATMF
jgi:Holliday junction resolvasome RuvABC endonuclease subunit